VSPQKETISLIRPALRMFRASAILAVVFTTSAFGATDPAVRPFRSIQQVFTQSCALSSCHSAVSRKGGLILEHEDVSYESLVDHRAEHPDAQALGLLRVASGDPAHSFLMRKLKGEGPGDAMPQGGGMLPDDVIQMIEDWIRRGAHTTAEECPALDQTLASGSGAHGQGTVATICDDKPVGGDFVWQPEPPLDPPPATEGIQLYVPPKPVAAGTEWETCYAFRPNLTNLQTRVISHQEYRMHKGSHHLLLYMYFGEHPEEFAEGFFPCQAGQCVNPGQCPSDSDRNQFPIGGTQVAGTAYQVNYPEGVGLPILSPGKVVFIANLHFTNPFQPPQDIYGEAWINLYVHRPHEFKAMLDGIFAINFQDLIVEPYETKTISRMWHPRSFLTGSDTDAAVFQLFGHMHKRGREFDIDFVDRPCTGDCDENNAVTMDELVKGVNIALGAAPMRRCAQFDRNGDNQVTISEIVEGVGIALHGCHREDTRIYRTTEWDNAPVEEYPPPYLLVDQKQGLRWSCTHQNGRLDATGKEDPTYPAKKCHVGCEACGWDEASRTCIFTRDGSNRVYQEGEPMPLVFGLLADDDMCNMFGYFIKQSDLALLP
jgi:hypothetical protein